MPSKLYQGNALPSSRPNLANKSEQFERPSEKEDGSRVTTSEGSEQMPTAEDEL